MANKEQLEILKRDVAEWNAYVAVQRRKAGQFKIDLIGADLQEAKLRGVNLEGASLWKARLSGAYLGKANLRKVDLREADLTGANLRDAILLLANLRKVQLSGADLGRAQLVNADLGLADLRRVNFLEARLERANLTEADLRRSDLRGARLTNAQLADADLTETQLGMADLRWANLNGAILRAARLVGADLKQANLLNGDLGKANLTGADLRWANLTGANFEGGDLQSVNIKTGVLSAKLTDISDSLNLEQSQLDSMSGDSLTKIPAHLTRPTHWRTVDKDEDLKPQPETMQAIDPEQHEKTISASKQRPAAYQFTIEGKLITALPVSGGPQSEELTNQMLPGLLDMARHHQGLSGNRPARARQEAEALIDLLTNWEEVPNLGSLLLKSNALRADIAAYSTPEGQEEITPEQMRQMILVQKSLDDFLLQFDEVRQMREAELEIELHWLGVADIHQTLDRIVRLVEEGTEVVDHTVPEVLAEGSDGQDGEEIRKRLKTETGWEPGHPEGSVVRTRVGVLRNFFGALIRDAYDIGQETNVREAADD